MNFNGYDFYYHIRDAKLRSYNRINTYMNIIERHGLEVGKRYLRKFNRDDKITIFKMMKEINGTGFEQYRRNFMRMRNA